MCDVISENLRQVQKRIDDAANRAGRDPGDITLVAVTKKVDVAQAAILFENGVTHLGENRPQEMWRKADNLPNPVRWHMIGNLQRNKVSRTLEYAELIHSVDSSRLLRTIETEADKRGRTVQVLLQVNVSGEASKSGWDPQTLRKDGPKIMEARHVQVAGLMGMAAWVDDEEEVRASFRLLRQLRDELHTVMGCKESMKYLSMGMTNDFEIAVEEGATHLRIGSALFRGLESRDGNVATGEREAPV
jgi:pyridoxal phosphate enzyme (YggS family)